MKKLSGETRLLLIMGLIVLIGGGYLAFSSSGGADASGPGATSSSSLEPTPKPVSVETFDKLWKSSTHRKGEAPGATGLPDIAIIEFADLECPSCRFAYQKLTKHFGKAIPVAFAFRHYPLESAHPSARPCAVALEAAHKQGKFWELYNALFEEEKPALSISYIEERARKAGLNPDKLRSDSTDPATEKLVDKDMQIAQEELGLLRTPTFLIYEKKKNAVTISVGPRTAMEVLQGIPGVPTPEPKK
jgi:hypothetical protein